MKSRLLPRCGGNRRRRGECGQALVETALISPLLFLLLLGAAELARVAYAAIEVTNAARAAVQYASQQNGDYQAMSGGITNAATTDAHDLSGITAIATSGDTCSDASTVSYDSNAAPYCTSGHYVPNVTVTTSVNFDPLIHLPFLPNTITLHGQATEDCLDCL